jgi:hypothetical protein
VISAKERNGGRRELAHQQRTLIPIRRNQSRKVETMVLKWASRKIESPKMDVQELRESAVYPAAAANIRQM